MDFYIPQRDFSVFSVNSAFVREVSKGFYFAGEMHDYWEMVYCIEGDVMVSEDDRIFELSGGQLIFHAPMEFHRIWTKRSQRAKYMIISFSSEGELINSLGDGVFSLTMSLKHRLEESYEDLASTFNCDVIPIEKGIASPIEENIALLRFELMLLSIALEVDPDSKQSHSVSAAGYKKALHILKENIDQNLSVSEIANKCIISTSNLKKIFKQYAGCGVIEYYNKLRILRACSLLRSGMSVGDVSNLMNYSSPNYFTTVFKREMGVTPTKYIRE